jgi:hypothetical protein
MRFVVLGLGVLGVLGAAFVGWVCMDEHFNLPPLAATMIRDIPEFRMRYIQEIRAWPFLYAGAALGLLGSLLALSRRRFSSAALLLVGGLGGGVFIIRSLIFTSPMLLAGVLAFLIGPAKPKPAVEDEGDETEADKPSRKSAGKRAKTEDEEEEVEEEAEVEEAETLIKKVEKRVKPGSRKPAPVEEENEEADADL